jgi:hypothetical protein
LSSTDQIARVPQSAKNQKESDKLLTYEFSDEALREMVERNLSKNEQHQRNVYFTASETGENFSFEKDKSRLIIDPSAPFAEMVEETCLENPQSDTRFILPPKIDIKEKIGEKDFEEPVSTEVVSPKFGVKTIEFPEEDEKPLQTTPRMFCKKESLSSIEELSNDGTLRSKNYSSLLSLEPFDLSGSIQDQLESNDFKLKIDNVSMSEDSNLLRDDILDDRQYWEF